MPPVSSRRAAQDRFDAALGARRGAGRAGERDDVTITLEDRTANGQKFIYELAWPGLSYGPAGKFVNTSTEPVVYFGPDDCDPDFRFHWPLRTFLRDRDGLQFDTGAPFSGDFIDKAALARVGARLAAAAGWPYPPR